MSRKWSSLVFIGIALWMSGCSSSPTTTGSGDDVVPTADAGTDAVPQASAENPTPPATDTAAAPSTPADPGSAAPPVAAGADPATPATTATTATTAAAADAPPPVAEPKTEAPVAASAPAAPAPAAAPAADPAPATQVAEKEKATSESSSESHQASSGGSGIASHRIRRGDTLMKIAFRVYGDIFKWKEIYEANKDKISDPNSLPVGVELNIQDATPVKIAKRGEKYMIRQGDTLGSISQDVYGTPTKWKKIWKNNKELIRDPNRIFAGFYVYYTMSDKDREELERFKGSPLAQAETPQPQMNPAPADLGNAANRSPASLSMPSMPQKPAMPTAMNAAAPPAPNAVAAPGGK